MILFQLRLFASLAIILSLSACATPQTYTPIIDLKGVDAYQYQQDLAECRQYGAQVNPAGDAAGGALLGGGIGAALGAATGAVFGSPGSGAAVGAAIGGIGSGAGGGLDGVEKQKQIINNCLLGRGYRLLG
jgi:hypothetical protein